MIESINLIPQEEVTVQQKTEAVKTSTYITLGILVLAILASLYFFLASNNIKKQIVQVDTDISSLRGQITKLSLVEVSARNLDKKFNVLQTMFKERSRYSLLLEELKSRNPDELVVDSIVIHRGSKRI